MTGDDLTAPLHEIARRSHTLISQRFLPIDYYRIRKRLALPLPITGFVSPQHPVRNFQAAYPWNIWLLWSLEERIETLGAQVQWTGNTAAQTAVESDLNALAAWPTYRDSHRPDLPFAHAVRILWLAAHQWTWPEPALTHRLRAALQRAIDDALPLSDALFGQFDQLDQLLATQAPHQHLHNIPLIGTCALALAAEALQHPQAPRLNARVARLFSAVLELRRSGFTEGVSYDGYVLTFIADWLSVQPPTTRATLLEHPCFDDILHQAIALSAPGHIMETAPLGDVEPHAMPFIWSAMAKLNTIRPNAQAAWALSQCPLSHLRADALTALAHTTPATAPLEAPAPSRLNAAIVLRTGYAAEDLAVAIGHSRSPMGHIQHDNGSLVIGTRGRWWLDDPGYQQYLNTAERRFTIGPTAHNAPLINGHAQTHKRPEPVAVTRLDATAPVQFAWIDLTACYPPEAQAEQVRRAVWLIDDRQVVVCDEVSAPTPPTLTYHWHGHPSLHWCLQDGAAILVSPTDPDVWLHLFSPQFALSPADLDRLPGSRGHLSLSVTLQLPTGAAVWWVFSLDAARPDFQLDAARLRIGEAVVTRDPRLPATAEPLRRPPSRPDPLTVNATRHGEVVTARCTADPEHFAGELEYAFYLMAGGQKALVHWYTDQPEVRLTVPPEARGQTLEVRGFVREKANPEKKLMRAVGVA